MSLLGLDIGTTGTKASIFDEGGDRLSDAYREYPLHHPQPGWIELDPVEVWEAVREAVSEAAGRVPSDPVRAMAISVLGEAAVPVEADGTPLENSILGFDNRAAGLFEEWMDEMDAGEIMRITGQPPSQMFTLAKLMWIKWNRADLYRRMDRYVTFGGFAQVQMGLEPHVDYSMAARTMAFDIHRKRYSERICEAAEVDPDKFCPAVPTGHVVGALGRRAAGELGLPEGCLVCAGSHDQPAGALGSGVTRGGVAMDATGTVECFAVAMDQPAVNDTMLENNLACYPHAVPDRFVSIAYNFTGGALLRWARDTFGGIEKQRAEETGTDPYEALIEQMPDQPTDILVQPHFTMAGTPYMDPDPVGGILGLTLSTTRGQFLRALLEGVSYEMKLNLEILERAGVSVREFRAVGGGAKSDFWLQLKADVYNRPVSRLEVAEAASFGMALVAGEGAGVYESAAQAAEKLINVRETFQPRPEHAEIYDEMFGRYRRLRPALKQWQQNTNYGEVQHDEQDR